jgi:hypothetical protein
MTPNVVQCDERPSSDLVVGIFATQARLLYTGHDKANSRLGVDQRTPHVVPAVSRQRAEPGLHRVDGLETGVEAHVLANFEDQLRVFVGDLGPLLGDDHFGYDIAVADRAALGLGDRLIGVVGYAKRAC